MTSGRSLLIAIPVYQSKKTRRFQWTAQLFSVTCADEARLVSTMAFRLARPHHLVDINGIEALRRLGVEHGKLVIGAGVRHQAFHRPVVDSPLGRLLSAVMRHIAHYPIRTRGTFCGSVAHADPASEWCLVAATLGAEMVARSARGSRIIPAADYFQGIMTTALEPDELLAEVRLPILASDT